MIFSQVSFDDVVHEQFEVTVTLLRLPPLVRLADVGESEVVQETPAWVSVKVCPAIVRVPVRTLVEVFGVTSQVTVPLPVPDFPDTMVSHVAVLVAVQVQTDSDVETDTVPRVPPLPMDELLGDSV